MHQHFQFPYFWLVWTGYAWYCFLTTRSRSWLIVSAVSFVGMSLGSFYLMYMGFLSLLTGTIVFHCKVRSLVDRKTVLHTACAAVLVILILVPFGLPYFEVSKMYGLKRPLGEAIQYSADPLISYLLPNNDSVLYQEVDHGQAYAPFPGEEKLFATLSGWVGGVTGSDLTGGKYSEGVSLEQFHSIWRAGREERRLFPGYSVLALAILGIFAAPSGTARTVRLLLCTLLICSVLLSLGPVIVSFGHPTYIPGPYIVLYYILPGLEGMRAAARFGYVALAALSGLAGMGWSVLARRWFSTERKFPGKSLAVLGVWLLIFSAENFPARSQSYDRPQAPPPIYAFLTGLEIEGGIIEVPTFKGTMKKTDPEYGDRRTDYRNREYMYMYFSTFHWRPIYNGYGAFPGPHQFAVRDAIRRLPDAEAVALLKQLGLNTLVLHTYWFEEEDMEFWSKEEILKILEQIADVGGAKIYRLVKKGSYEVNP